MIDNMDKFEPSSEVPNINCTHKHNLHVLTANCSSHMADVYLATIKLHDAILFHLTLKYLINMSTNKYT